MNITPRIKSTRNHHNIVLNLSIELPCKNKCQHTSLSPSPNHNKKYKLTYAPHEHKSTHVTNAQTVRDFPYAHTEVYPTNPSRKKHTVPTPIPSSRGGPPKVKSAQLSPKKKSVSRKGKETRIVRNISILEKVVSEEDNIIKYTSNSNELKEKLESMRQFSSKVDTHVSEVDIAEIRQIQQKYREGKESQTHRIAADFLRSACAKKIQRAWKRYRTKKLIRQYSNDIRKKDAKKVELNEQLTIKSARSQGSCLKLKKKIVNQQQVQTERSSMAKFQEESIQKWEQMLQKIKNQKNVDTLLQISMERTEQLKQGIGIQCVKNKPEFFDVKNQTPTRDKIIKTKSYYQEERDKRKDLGEKSIGSLKREERVKYFENQMLKIENDLSEISEDSKLNSSEGEQIRELQEIENIKLRKKLQIFKEHLPGIHPFASQSQHEEKQHHSRTGRIDIAAIMKKKNEDNLQNAPSPQIEQEVPIVPTLLRATQQIGFADTNASKKLTIVQEQLQNIETHRQWASNSSIQQEQSMQWKQRLSLCLRNNQEKALSTILEQFVLEALIQISQSQKLVQYIKTIYEQGHKKSKKPEGIVTSHASIKDYLNYFINYLYQHKLEGQLQNNLLKPIGPSGEDVLKYFRGEDLPYDPDSQYVMNIKIFNQHWKYANQFIYFDPKYQDKQKQAQRVTYLKQLTKVFFRSIFDCLNQSLEFQRMYGMRGRPYPWSLKKINYEIPSVRKAILDGFQRVIKVSTVFCGVLFADKQHNLDKRAMDEITEENMVKLILLECDQDQILWNFYEDELVQIKLQLAKYIEQRLIMQIVKVIGTDLLRQ